ncbi:MAG: DNA-binding LacI/PurR family transcriptional regulator [Verrucomicrobiales bacterium]
MFSGRHSPPVVASSEHAHSMNLVPERKSLLAATTSVLRDAILAGEWTTELPGERTLCSRMQVGRDTLRLALKQLEREGVIGAGDPGKRRSILKTAKRGTAVDRAVAYLTPHRLERLSETTLAEIDVVRGQLADVGFRLEIVNSPAYNRKRPAAALKKLVAERNAQVWMLHQSTQPMQRWFFDAAVPCLLHGFPHEGIDLPFVDIDYFAAGRHAGGFLSGRGHERIALVRPDARLRGLDLAEQGLSEALASPLRIVRDPGDAQALSRQIDLLLKMDHRPTALVLTRSRQALTIATHLGQTGRRVPDDLSLVVLDYVPYLEFLLPKMACYRINVQHAARMMVRKALELAGSGSTTRTSQALMPDFVAGDSVARK